MGTDALPAFDELVEIRRTLGEATRPHKDVLLAFQESGRQYFRKVPPAPTDATAPPVSHLTTTATCLESLADIPHDDEQEQSGPGIAKTIAATFGPAALALTQWQSEGEDSGAIYSRVRTLP